MHKIIVLTGVIGAGKSTIADSFCPPAFAIHADILQHDAVRRAFPFIRKDREYSWRAWPRDIETIHIDRLLNISLLSTHHALFQHSGAVIVEGCILAEKWFRDSLIAEIRNISGFPSNVDVHLLDLIPPPERVQCQILERKRDQEIEPYSDIEFVKKHIKMAEGRTSMGGWTRFGDVEPMEAYIGKILSGP